MVRFHQDAFNLSSYLLQAKSSNNYRNQVRVENAILLTTRGPQPEDRMPLLHVQWGSTAKKYDLDMTKRTPFYTGATINDKADDLQVLMWLSKPGNRYTGVVGQNVPHAAYVSWPGVHVVGYRTDAAPVLPAIEDVDPQVLYNLALKMAQVRGETECLLAGLYWVLDYIGVPRNL